jgi:hypothetical protein
VSQIPALENAVYADVSMLAVSFSIAHSKWNQRFGSDVAVVRVKETLEYDIRPADVHEVSGCCCEGGDGWGWRCCDWERSARVLRVPCV